MHQILNTCAERVSSQVFTISTLYPNSSHFRCRHQLPPRWADVQSLEAEGLEVSAAGVYTGGVPSGTTFFAGRGGGEGTRSIPTTFTPKINLRT